MCGHTSVFRSMRASPAYSSFATVLRWFQDYTTARRQTMDPRRMFYAMRNSPVAFVLLVMGSDISNAFLGNIWTGSQTPFALSSRWFIPITPQGDGRRCFHADCSLHAARERKEAQDPPRLIKIQTPPPVCLRHVHDDAYYTTYINSTWQLFVDDIL